MIELRDTSFLALSRLDEVVVAAESWVEADGRDFESRGLDLDAGTTQLRSQAGLFASLEAFLAAYARVSLLLFPVSKRTFAKERAAELCRLLSIDDQSLLKNRTLRNCWMHHDERLDTAMERGRPGQGQRFTRSSNVTDDDRSAVLRLIEVDALKISVHDDAGTPQEFSIAGLRRALEEVEVKIKAAYAARLPGVVPAPSSAAK